jgi:YidC/Oxa1 family membrane protein insertase
MKSKAVLTVLAAVFLGACAILVFESGLFCNARSCSGERVVPLISTASADALEAGASNSNDVEGAGVDEVEGSRFAELSARSAKTETRTIGSIHKDTGFKLEAELTSKGAALRTVTLSEFDDRDPEEPAPLVLLSPIVEGQSEICSLANGNFRVAEYGATNLGTKAFPLDKLNWRVVSESEKEVVFEATLSDSTGAEAVKLTKRYLLAKDSYNLACDLTIDNLSGERIQTSFKLQGPAGINREEARSDMRRITVGFLTEGEIDSVKKDNNKLRRAKKKGESSSLELKYKNSAAHFVWAAITNKYFAAILRPVPAAGDYPENSTLERAEYYDPDLLEKRPSGSENSTFKISTVVMDLAVGGQEGSTQTLQYQLYLGPKDRSLFEKNELYKRLGYFHTIDFRTCCCPAGIIRPLAFGIMALMKWMYTMMGPLGNYGVVIMILVFLVRILMHPITKKSQMSMMRMQKLGPKMEEIKSKYANNKAEMNKRVMALYKEEGVSPFSSMLPMMIQMPIWIALWTAIYASVELRGAGFLPVWITDLSAPDALIRFKAVEIPIVGWQIDSFNLLPILMGVVMYLQQKLMPHSASSAQTNPQVAQQQKMMMIMMPLMFPLMLYKGPSGVNLYIMSSISAGVFEQVVIRKHIREKEEAEAKGLVAVTSKTGGKVKKKKPKPFFRDH